MSLVAKLIIGAALVLMVMMATAPGYLMRTGDKVPQARGVGSPGLPPAW